MFSIGMLLIATVDGYSYVGCVISWVTMCIHLLLQAVAAKAQPKQKVVRNVPKSAPRVGGKR